MSGVREPPFLVQCERTHREVSERSGPSAVPGCALAFAFVLVCPAAVLHWPSQCVALVTAALTAWDFKVTLSEYSKKSGLTEGI